MAGSIRVTPKRVNFLTEHADQDVFIMGALGWATDKICKHTGYSKCQVTYRLGRAEVKRADYRNGESPISLTVYHTARKLNVVTRALTRVQDKTAAPAGAKPEGGAKS